MNLTEAENLALTLMQRHRSLTDWQFMFDTAPTRLGLCTYATRTISLSGLFAGAATEPEVRQALLHEIAHALVGPYYTPKYGVPTKTGHSPVWKRMARSIGYVGGRSAVNPYADRVDAS